MKLAILSLLLPITSFAADFTCGSIGADGNQIDIRVQSTEDISRPGAKLEIRADGVLHLVFPSVVEAVKIPGEKQLALAISTLNANGEKDANSGEATIELKLEGEAGRENVTSGTLTLRKVPKGGQVGLIQLQPGATFALNNCRGTL